MNDFQLFLIFKLLRKEKVHRAILKKLAKADKEEFLRLVELGRRNTKEWREIIQSFIENKKKNINSFNFLRRGGCKHG